MAKKIGNVQQNPGSPSAPAEAPKAPKVKKERVKKERHVKATFPIAADQRPLKVAVPEGFSFKDHKSLKPVDFEKPYLYTEFRAAEIENRANALLNKVKTLREEAHLEMTTGNGKVKNAAKRATRLATELETLTRTLREAGIDVEALLKNAATPAPAEAAPAAE
jgi:hypothetical protein